MEDPACNEAFAALRTAQGALDATRAEAEQSFSRDTFRISRQIDRLAADERFREAVTWQNRKAVVTALDSLVRNPAEPGRRGSQRRQHEELVASYLQRYCVKNDTIGFFGPLGYCEWADEGRAVQVWPGRELLDRREVFFENWCVDALAQRLSAEPALRPWLTVRLKSSFFLEGDTLHQPFGPPLHLPVVELRLLAGCNGRRTARSLARELLADASLGLSGEDEIYARLDDLCRRRILTWTLEVPLELHPDRTLEEQLRRIEPEELRAPALAALEELRERKAKVARAAGDSGALGAALRELEEAFTRLTGTAAHHHAGQMYAGRGLVYEDCRRNVEARFGPELLARLSPPLGLLLGGARWLAGEMTRRVEEKLLAIHRELRRRSGREAVDSHGFYVQALASLFVKRERDECFAAAEREYQQRWSQILGLPEKAVERRLGFTVGELEDRWTEAFADPRPAWSLAHYCSPDILIAAAGEEALRRGDYEIVLGEVHSGNTMLWSCFMAQHPDPGRIVDALRDDAGTRSFVFPQMMKHSTPQRVNIGALLPQFYWYQFADDPPARGGAGALPAGAVVIEEQEGRLWARTRDGGLEFAAIDLFSSLLIQECNSIIGDLLPPSAHRPRVSVDGVVIARERWKIALADLDFINVQEPVERFRAARRWARQTGLPRFCFYRTPAERKPCYMDWESPIYLDIFARLARAAGEAPAGEGRVTLSEMLPGPDQIWLSDAEGRRYTCEVRLVALEEAGGAAGSIPDRDLQRIEVS